MKRFFIFNENRNFRNVVLIAALTSVFLAASSGCAIFGKKNNDDAKVSEFEEDPEKSENSGDSDVSVFDAERKKQSEMSDFVSSFGKKSKNKKEVDPGQTFLMSDRAKEIYANTER